MVAVGIIISGIKKNLPEQVAALVQPHGVKQVWLERNERADFLFRQKDLVTCKTRGRANVISHILARAFMHAHTQSCSLQQWNHCVKSLSYRGGGDIPSSGCLSHKSRSNQS